MLKIDLTGHTAVVTGGTGQLGRAIVRTLADCGADVAIHYHHNEQMARKLLAEVAGMGRNGCIAKADVTQEADVMHMRDEISAKIGAPDIICCNAVIQYKWTHILDQPLTDYQSQFDSCVTHNVLMAKAFVPAMIEKGWGRVVGTNTECSMQCFPTQSAYVAGKRGMDGIYRILAKEVGKHNITVNQVAPGWTISEDHPKTGPGFDDEYIKNVPLGHRGEAQNIANAVAFFASDLAKFITGMYLPVCGGYVMPRI